MDIAPPCPERGNRRSRVIGPSDSDAEAAVGLWLKSDEAVVARLTGLGASLFVTERRLVIVREGAEHRPRTGVRSWPYRAIHEVSLSPLRRGQARIVVRTGPRPEDKVSMFFSEKRWPDAEHAIGEIRRLLRLDGDQR
jgi:hypothetical protein